MMKIIKYIFLLLIFSTSIQQLSASWQWEKINSIPPGYINNYWLEIWFLNTDSNYGWVCGFGGNVIRTTDGGKTWRGSNVGGSFQLESVHFVDQNTGYVSGQDNDTFQGGGVIFKSTNGGATWINVTPSGASNLWGNYFLDANNGMVIGGGCDITRQEFYRTTNGGISWTMFSSNYPSSGLTDLILYPDGTGFAASSGKLWRTFNGGNSWEIFSTPESNNWQEDLWHIGNSFLMPYSIGCGGGDVGGGFLFSTDMGKSWKNFSVGHPCYGAFLLDDRRGWGCGSGSSLYYTSDAGKTWDLRNCGIDPDDALDDLWFVDDTLGWVCGKGGLYKTVEKPASLISITAIGDTLLCLGDSVQLTCITDFKYYIWSNGSTKKSIWVKDSGDYYLKAMNNKCDTNISNKIHIKLLPLPDIKIQVEGLPFICTGDSVRLYPDKSYSTYYWNTGDKTDTLVVKKGGRYTLTITDSNGCSNSDILEVKEAPRPFPQIIITGRKTICEGDSVKLLATPDSMKQYDWYKLPDASPFSHDRGITITDSGKYYVKITNEFGCDSLSPIITINTIIDSNRLEAQLSAKFFKLDSTLFSSMICGLLQIYNRGDVSYSLSNTWLLTNTQFSIPLSQFPIIIGSHSTNTIKICFLAQELDLQTDSLIIYDNCTNHIIPVEAVSVPDIYGGNTRCDAPVILTTAGLAGRILVTIGTPYPMPLGRILHIPYEKRISKNILSDNISIDASLSNSIGEILTHGYIKSNNSIDAGEDKFELGEIEFDLNNLSSGAYFIFLKLGDDTSIIPVLKSE